MFHNYSGLYSELCSNKSNPFKDCRDINGKTVKKRHTAGAQPSKISQWGKFTEFYYM